MEIERLRGKLMSMRNSAAEVCKAAEEALALLPAPEEASKGYEGDVVGHLRSIAGHGAVGGSDGGHIPAPK